MAETAICYIQGTVEKVEEASSGWTHFFIDKGSEYSVKLSTKKEDIVAAARAVRDSGAVASWKYQLSLGSENPHRPGTRYKNRRLEAVKEGRHGEVTEREPELDGDTPSQTTTQRSGGSDSAASSEGDSGKTYTQNDLHPEGVRRVDEAGRRKSWSIAISQATEQLKHTFANSEDADEQWARIDARAALIVRRTSGEWAFDRDPVYLPEALRPDPSAPQPSQNPGGRDNADEPAEYNPPVDDDIPF